MDNIEIKVIAGKGGNGAVSFWREKFQPFGGPDGGDGGKGGDIYIIASSNEQDMSSFRNVRNFRAEEGKNGGKQKKHGRDGNDLFLRVPVGTTIYKKEEGSKLFIADLRVDGQSVLVATGGKGGLGNVHFASSTRKAPREATNGKPGEIKTLVLEQRLRAAVCIIGLPNSGKSSLLARISSATPKIAEYPFTTVGPVMGNVNYGYESFSIAEIPALIEGSNTGKGLGNKFLRHCEKTRVLLLLLNGTSSDPVAELSLLLKELHAFKPELLNKSMVIALNKLDIREVSDRQEQMSKVLAAAGYKAHFISSLEGTGVEALVAEIAGLVRQSTVDDIGQEAPEYIFRPKPVPRRKQ